MDERRYQVFLSSTYVDLVEERQKAIEALLRSGCFPAGMELFPAADEEQMQYIRRLISDCDYYIVMVGGRYGSIDEKSGLSYTELEYNHAIEAGIPVIRLLRRDLSNLPREHRESNREKQKNWITFAKI